MKTKREKTQIITPDQMVSSNSRSQGTIDSRSGYGVFTEVGKRSKKRKMRRHCTKTIIVQTITTSLLFLISHAANASELTLKKGTTSLGGSAKFSVTEVLDTSLFQLNVSPNVGYFVTDKLELVGLMQYSIFGTQERTTSGLSNIGGGANILTDVGTTKLYVGALIEYGCYSLACLVPTGASGKVVRLSGQLGFLYPLNSYLAIDLAVRPGLYFLTDRSVFTFEAGWLGMKAYF